MTYFAEGAHFFPAFRRRFVRIKNHMVLVSVQGVYRRRRRLRPLHDLHGSMV